MVTPRWVDADQVILLNETLLEGTKEPHFLRDRGALESAVARPQNYHCYTGDASVSKMMAELIYGVGKAHAFQQGNKRTAWAAGRLFAYLNGYRVETEGHVRQQALAEAIERSLTVDESPAILASLLEPKLIPLI